MGYLAQAALSDIIGLYLMAVWQDQSSSTLETFPCKLAVAMISVPSGRDKARVVLRRLRELL